MEKTDPDQPLKDKILSIREPHPNYGYRRIYATLVKDGWEINRKKYNACAKSSRYK